MTKHSHAAGVPRTPCLDGEAASAGAVEPRGNAACEAVTEHIWVPPHQVEDRLAEGWRVADGWRNAEHHLRYSLPMWRPVEDGDA